MDFLCFELLGKKRLGSREWSTEGWTFFSFLALSSLELRFFLFFTVRLLYNLTLTRPKGLVHRTNVRLLTIVRNLTIVPFSRYYIAPSLSLLRILTKCYYSQSFTALDLKVSLVPSLRSVTNVPSLRSVTPVRI